MLLRILVLVAIGSLTHTAWAAENDLRYHWKKGSEHYYRVSIAAELEEGQNEFTANPFYHVLSSEDGELKLLWFGGLQEDSGPFRGRPPAITQFIPRAAGLPLDGDTKLTINDRGKVVTQQGKSPLPFLLGELAQLPFVLLPKGDEKSWTNNRDVTLANPERGVRLPPLAQLEKSMQAEEETTYTITEQEGSVTKIKIESKLATLERTKQKPTVELITDATAKFDSKVGGVTSYKAKIDLTLRRKNTTTEIPITVSVERVSDEEVAKLREQAEELMAKVKTKMAADEAERKRPLEAGDVDDIVKALKGSNRDKINEALRKLSEKSPDKPDKRISKAIEPHLASKDVSTVLNAFNAMKNWATEDSVPALLESLDNSQSIGRLQAVQLLGKFPSKKVAEELGLMLTDPSLSGIVAQSLKDMGKHAEEPALSALKKTSDKDFGQLLSIVQVLKDVGGPKSLAALKPIAAGSGLASSTAQNAIRDIERRIERDKLRKR